MHSFLYRNTALSVLRDFFRELQLQEVLTPLLVPSGAMEPYLDTFRVGEFHLPTSPEFSLKKILAMMPEGRGVYEIAHAFRNEQTTRTHLAEFTMAEWYIRDFGYEEFTEQVQDLVSRLAGFPVPAESFTFDELAGKTGVTGTPEMTASELSVAIMDYIDPFIQSMGNKLIAVKDFPPALSGMAQTDSVARRIEFYLNGHEIANAYQEAWDPVEMRARWQQNNALRLSNNADPHPVDERLLAVLPSLEGVAGIALGIERTLMAIHGWTDIRIFNGLQGR